MKFVRDTWLIFLRASREGMRNPILAFVLPAVPGLIVMGLVSELYGSIVRLPGFPTREYIAWMAPGVVVTTAMTGAGFTATGLALDARSGYLDRLRLLPLNPVTLILGRLLFEAVRVVPGSLAVAGVGALLADELAISAVGVIGIVLLTAAWAVAWNGIFHAASLRNMNPQTSAALQPMFLPFMFLSTQFVPPVFMPGWIERVSGFNPHTYIVEGGRSFFGQGFHWGDLGAAVGVILALAIATQVIAARQLASLVRGD